MGSVLGSLCEGSYDFGSMFSVVIFETPIWQFSESTVPQYEESLRRNLYDNPRVSKYSHNEYLAQNHINNSLYIETQSPHYILAWTLTQRVQVLPYDILCGYFGAEVSHIWVLGPSGSGMVITTIVILYCIISFSILFYSILYYSVLFCSILFYYMIFYYTLSNWNLSPALPACGKSASLLTPSTLRVEALLLDKSSIVFYNIIKNME